jgi:hypothetical protein
MSQSPTGAMALLQEMLQGASWPQIPDPLYNDPVR